MRSEVAIFTEVTTTVAYNVCKLHVVQKKISGLSGLTYLMLMRRSQNVDPNKDHCIGEIIPRYFMISSKQALQNI